MHTILLVEDEKNLLSTIKLNLELDGYEVIAYMTAEDAWQRFKGMQFNLIILDVTLPGMNGYQLCENIRKVDKKTPILFLTSRSSPEDRISGLKLGADDYLGKPFHLEELLLRVKSLLKRSQSDGETNGQDLYKFGKCSINFKTYEVYTKAGEKKELSKREIDLLKILIERKNEVIPRELILKEVWGYESIPSTRTIDNHIVVFRKYFEDDPKNPLHFHSIRGVGYKFTE
ncbi:MAG TPA: response regulator transcription factor [Bacteroidia bacterium]|jgi:two-component system alkaline phosphatase synthesis response regulator PhoP|nr:response regulator transcription factor [Bacteroidia bacterium]